MDKAIYMTGSDPEIDKIISDMGEVQHNEGADRCGERATHGDQKLLESVQWSGGHAVSTKDLLLLRSWKCPISKNGSG